LRQLFLISNNIGSYGSVAIAKALETNRTLEWLFLGTNNILSYGVWELPRL